MTTKTLARLTTITLLSAALGACGGAPKKLDSLDQAHVAYDRASNDQKVARHAADELDKARKALDMADNAWNRDEEKVSANHYADLASRRVEIAELVAMKSETNIKIENMKGERQRVQLDLRAQEVERARLETQALQLQMANMQAKNTERGMVLTLGDVLFDTGQASLKSGSARNLQKVASFMVKNKDRDAIIEGHTDNMGDDDYNMNLSRERAFAVRSQLVQLGVSPRRITTRGFGETKPVSDNGTNSGRQQNRRVEIIFPDDDTQVSELDE